MHKRGVVLVTGGTGFIGSNVVARLADLGHEVVISDTFGTDDKWKNVAKHRVEELLQPEQLTSWLAAEGSRVDAIVHMGAISATTESDVDLIVRSNVQLTQELFLWCARQRRRFIYASSAATYGDGTHGFIDEFTADALSRLRPLNPYGWSKHFIDRWWEARRSRGDIVPPQCVGLKFFNVYGPNEYHKGSMKSVIAQNHAKVRDGEAMRLFRSHRRDYVDGGQLRDFVYVRDCVDVIEWLLATPSVSGLFNLGTGKARSWKDLAETLFAACDRPPRIEYIDMPVEIRDRYQYYTEAKMDSLRAAGYTQPFTSLEDGIRDYVALYLSTTDRYR